MQTDAYLVHLRQKKYDVVGLGLKENIKMPTKSHQNVQEKSVVSFKKYIYKDNIVYSSIFMLYTYVPTLTITKKKFFFV